MSDGVASAPLKGCAYIALQARKRMKDGGLRKTARSNATTVEDRRRAGALKDRACADGGTRIRSFLVKVAPKGYEGVPKGGYGRRRPYLVCDASFRGT